MNVPPPRAILFDLLTALIDSWSLWDAVAGNRDDGRRWRAAYLRITYGEGRYRAYEALVREAAVESGLRAGLADELAARYAELQPWPEAAEVLGELHGRFRLGVVTNCSETLGYAAAGRLGIRFDAVVTAERVGWYKPHPAPYRLALDQIGVRPEEALFVAGSAYDLGGAAAVGMAVFWHNRIGLTAPHGAPSPLAEHPSLRPLAQSLIR